jgi:site-specific DNA-methyltransferase (adenine-specific)
LDEQSGNKTGQRGVVKGTEPSHSKKNAIYGDYSMVDGKYAEPKDGLGGASRFFYCPKANKSDRNEGMPEPVPQFTARPRREDGTIIYKETHPEEWAEAMKGKPRSEKTSLGAAEEIIQQKKIKGRDAGQDERNVPHKARPSARQNIHPTVKPTNLMTYLIRLVTPPNGIVLDPFMGSGSTGKAAIREGFNFVGIEREEEYMEIAQQRIEWEYKKQNPHNWF